MQNKQKSYICEVSTIIGKESFINAKKVLNFIQSLINENLIKSYKVLMKSYKESNKAPNIIPYNYVR